MGLAELSEPGPPAGGEPGLTLVSTVAYDDIEIAFAVHEMNGILQAAGREPHRQPHWDDATDEMRQQVLDLVRSYRRGTTPEQAHERWRSLMADRGWRYGPAWSDTGRTHPNLVPYGQLPERQRIKSRMSHQVTLVMVLGASL